MELSIFAKLTPYPFVHGDILYNSDSLSQNRNCLKCKKKECWENGSLTDFICPQQYNCYPLILNEQKYIINGIILKDNKTISQGRKDSRKEWVFDRSDVELFINRMLELKAYLTSKEYAIMERKNYIYHDFKTSLGIFFTCTQDIISKLPGDSFEDKLKNGDKAYQDLYNSLELITSQLGMIDVVINPKSIKFGTQRSINIHGLFQKMKMLFEHSPIQQKNVSIELIAEGWINDSMCFASIEFLPLILIDNAIKYSVSNSKIEIKLEQSYKNVKVLVKNIGPFVSDKNKDRIFEKFYRDESAQNFSKNGIGIGLWIAQQILQAHSSKLLYHKDTKEIKEVGLNIFEFNLTTI